jgi:hypothetical protein
MVVARSEGRSEVVLALRMRVEFPNANSCHVDGPGDHGLGRDGRDLFPNGSTPVARREEATHAVGRLHELLHNEKSAFTSSYTYDEADRFLDQLANVLRKLL